MRRVHFEGKHKLVDRWNHRPFIVTEIPQEGSPVYIIKPEDGIGTKKTVHRNLLMPINGISLQNLDSDFPPESTSRKTRSHKTACNKESVDKPIYDYESSSSSSDSELYIPIPVVPQGRSHYRPGCTTIQPNTLNQSVSEPVAAVSNQTVITDQNDYTHSILSNRDSRLDNTSHSVSSHCNVGDNIQMQPSHLANTPVEPVRRSGRITREPDRYGHWVNSLVVTGQEGVEKEENLEIYV